MPRRRLAVAAFVGIVLAAAWGVPATADTGTQGSTSASSDSHAGAVAVGASLQTTGGRQASSSATSRPRCRWEQWVTPPDLQPMLDALGPTSAVNVMLGQAAAADASLYMKWCPNDTGGETGSWSLVPNRVSVEDLISSASRQVSAQVPSPAMDMNPEPAVGGVVNIGLWLAVADPGQVSITASVGPVWATVTARYVRTTWDFGNGDSTACDGLGTAIVDKETAEQGPCGYTYRWPSAPKFTGTDDLAYHASVTGHWVVTYETSQGTGGSLSPIDRTTSFNYQVREIQTVRVAGNG